MIHISRGSKIRLIDWFSDWFATKQTSVWFQINRKMVNTDWFRFYLTRFRRDFCVYERRVMRNGNYTKKALLQKIGDFAITKPCCNFLWVFRGFDSIVTISFAWLLKYGSATRTGINEKSFLSMVKVNQIWIWIIFFLFI